MGIDSDKSFGDFNGSVDIGKKFGTARGMEFIVSDCTMVRRGFDYENARQLKLRTHQQKTTKNNDMDLPALFLILYDTVYLETSH